MRSDFATAGSFGSTGCRTRSGSRRSASPATTLTYLQLLGELRRIGRGRERLLGEHRRRGVMAVAAFAGRREARDDHVRLEPADGPDDVREDRVVSPDRQRLLGVLREAEVDGAREELLRAVDAPRGEQLLRADDAEELALLVADQVLSAVAAREREVAGAIQPLVAEVGEQRGVLVVGMRGDVERAADDGEFLERELDLRGIERLLREERSRER